MNEQKIRIKQYEQAANEKVSLGGIKWERKWDVCVQCDSREEADRVRASLTAQPEQEPVAHLWQHSETGRTRIVMPDQIITAEANWFVVGPLYLGTPPRREWVGLTEAEIAEITREAARGAATRRDGTTSQRISRAIEAKLREKNHA